MTRLFFIVFSLMIFSACGENSVKQEETTITTVSEKPKRERMGGPRPGKMVTDAQRKEVQLLISASKTAMDSIDAAYKEIRGSSKFLKLTVEERETVNEALQGLNILKELIILETQSAVIQQLKAKTSELNVVMDQMSEKSAKLNEIAAKIAKVSGIVKKTTDILAAALSSGVIKPNMTGMAT